MNMRDAPDGPAGTGPGSESPVSLPLSRRIEAAFRNLIFLIPLGIAGNVVFTLMVTDRDALASVVRLDPACLIIAMMFSLVPWFTDAARMSVWSAFLGKRVPYGELLRIVVAAELGAAVLPPATGGTPVKAALLMGKGFSGGEAVSLTLLSGLEDWLFFLIMVPPALMLSAAGDFPVVRDALKTAGAHGPWIAAGIGSIIVLFFLWLRRPAASGDPAGRFKSLGRRLWRESAGVYRLIAGRGKSRLLITMALTAVQWACRFSVVTLLVTGLGMPGRPVLYFALQVLVFGLAAFVPTPGAAGGAEALFYSLYRPFIQDGAVGLVTAGWRFLTFYFLLLVGILVFFASGMNGTKAGGGIGGLRGNHSEAKGGASWRQHSHRAR